MKTILYFTNTYPKVSHTFIRREIQALESIGARVIRVAARCDFDGLLDPEDISESQKTTLIFQGNQLRLILNFFWFVLRHPFRIFTGFLHSSKLGKNANYKLISNLAYLVEAATLVDISRRKKVSHIHAHFGTNSTSVAYLCKVLGGPGYSFTLHGPEEFDRPEVLSLPEKIAEADFVVAITSYCRSQLYRWTEFMGWEKIKVVHCTVDQKLLEKPLRPIENTYSFLTVGRLCEQKGQMLLLEAINELHKKGVNVELKLAGDGPLRGALAEYIKANGLESQVHFLGWQSGENIIEQLDHCSALLLPSFAEGLPVVIMEAFARARPVISTYIAGIPELVEDGVSGRLVSAGDVEALVEAIEGITKLTVDELTAQGLAGRKRVIADHDSVVEAKKLFKHIEQK